MQVRPIHTPQLKFCGFTREEDIDAALRCGVDAVGLNFYSKSPRFVDLETAKRFSARIGDAALKVGIFVDAPVEFILEHLEECQLDVVQLHGDESIGYLERLMAQSTSAQSLAIWRAISWRGSDFPEDTMRVEEWRKAIPSVTFLIDAHDPVNKGGTGKRARWDLLTPRPPVLEGVPFLLAGGITAENAAEAVKLVRPDGIDLASGIERSPGVKDHDLMARVSDAVRSAFESIYI